MASERPPSSAGCGTMLIVAAAGFFASTLFVAVVFRIDDLAVMLRISGQK